MSERGWPLAASLDEYLGQVVQTLRQASDRGIRSVQERPEEARRAIQDCEEILQVILAGDVGAWLA